MCLIDVLYFLVEVASSFDLFERCRNDFPRHAGAWSQSGPNMGIESFANRLIDTFEAHSDH